MKHKLQVNRLLIQAFSKALRLRIASADDPLEEYDFTNTNLYRIDLSGMVLKNVDVNANVNVSVFETNIRVIGGLLSAHMFSIRANGKLCISR